MLFPSLPTPVSAEESDTTATLALDSTVSITIPSTIEMDVAPTTSGTFTSTTSTLSIATNNPSGYDLYLSAADGDNVLRNENPSVQNTINPTTNGVTSTTMPNNTWGYNLTLGETPADMIYNAVPKEGTTALSTSNSPANDTYSLTFGTKVDTSIASGTYSSEVIISAVAKPVLITINFNGNGATSGSMSPIQVAVGGQVKLPANTYTKTDEVFTGWNTQADGGGTSYDDQATYTASTDPSESDLNVTLYAQWGPNVQYMQNFTKDQCQSLASSSNYTVVDSRDGSDYTVRYINGACWMTQNLRLPGGTTLTTSDSNVTRSYTLPKSSASGFDRDNYTVANMYNGTNTTYGAYYNYCAASAGTVCSQTKQDATQDICPKGWRLPIPSEMDGINGTSYLDAFSPVYSGYYSNGSLSNTGHSGEWWSATARYSNSQYYLGYAYGGLYTGDDSKYVGRSVRCVRSS